MQVLIFKQYNLEYAMNYILDGGAVPEEYNQSILPNNDDENIDITASSSKSFAGFAGFSSTDVGGSGGSSGTGTISNNDNNHTNEGASTSWGEPSTSFAAAAVGGSDGSGSSKENLVSIH